MRKASRKSASERQSDPGMHKAFPFVAVLTPHVDSMAEGRLPPYGPDVSPRQYGGTFPGCRPLFCHSLRPTVPSYYSGTRPVPLRPAVPGGILEDGSSLREG